MTIGKSWPPDSRAWRTPTRFAAGSSWRSNEAEQEPDSARRHAHLTFVVIGGGATGVEVAGALAEIDPLRCAGTSAGSIHEKRL